MTQRHKNRPTKPSKNLIIKSSTLRKDQSHVWTWCLFYNDSMHLRLLLNRKLERKSGKWSFHAIDIYYYKVGWILESVNQAKEQLIFAEWEFFQFKFIRIWVCLFNLHQRFITRHVLDHKAGNVTSRRRELRPIVTIILSQKISNWSSMRTVCLFRSSGFRCWLPQHLLALFSIWLATVQETCFRFDEGIN